MYRRFPLRCSLGETVAAGRRRDPALLAFLRSRRDRLAEGTPRSSFHAGLGDRAIKNLATQNQCRGSQRRDLISISAVGKRTLSLKDLPSHGHDKVYLQRAQVVDRNGEWIAFERNNIGEFSWRNAAANVVLAKGRGGIKGVHAQRFRKREASSGSMKPPL